MIIDPLGEIIYQKNKDEDVFTYTLEKEKVIQKQEIIFHSGKMQIHF